MTFGQEKKDQLLILCQNHNKTVLADADTVKKHQFLLFL